MAPPKTLCINIARNGQDALTSTLSVLLGHSGFSSPPQRPMTSDFEGFFIPDFIHYIYFLILILEKEPVFPFSMLSAKQGNYWYHFYNVQWIPDILSAQGIIVSLQYVTFMCCGTRPFSQIINDIILICQQQQIDYLPCICIHL